MYRGSSEPHPWLRESQTSQWNILCTFTEHESFLSDFIYGSFAVSNIPEHGGGVFWNSIVCVRLFFLEGEERPAGPESEVYMGKLILSGREVRRIVGPRSTMLRTVANDEERITVLREVFGMDIRLDDAQHIQGRISAL
jgi:hypothetical protein